MLKCWNGTSLFFSTKIWYFGYFFATIKHIYFLIIVAEADSNLAQVIIFWIHCSHYLVRYLGKLKMEILKHVVVLLYILEKVLCKPGVPVFIILERHYNIVKWYYHMPRVSQLTSGIGWKLQSHFWGLIKKNPTSGNWLTFFIPKNGIMGKWDCCKKPWE